MTELSNVEMKNKEINDTILININMMFTRRGYTNKMFTTDILKEIETNKVANFTLEGKKFSIYIMNQEIKNISSNSKAVSLLNEFNFSAKKIVNFGEKIAPGAIEITNSPRAQLDKECELLLVV